jgi:hypothetical protein
MQRRIPHACALLNYFLRLDFGYFRIPGTMRMATDPTSPENHAYNEKRASASAPARSP